MIELIMVIVILGILAATALPKFVNITGDAEAAALKGVIGSANSAMSINYSGCLVANNVVTANKCVKVKNCTDVSSLLQGGALPSGYTTADLGADVTTNGSNFTCTLTQTATTNTATFVGIAAGN